ncbi:MAG TPA: hypothetical protein VJ045_05210 [Hyphomicrobiaceae bacterium]|nr:hypothetical protein [Hyphomicrobiaceae bacterium]
MARSLIAASMVASAALALGAPARAEEAFTTRIEPRAFYGASVTIEEGVRVFRPLPTQRQVIVNPGGATPLSLSYNDTRVVEEATSHNYYYSDPYYFPRTYGLGGFPFVRGFGPRGFGGPARGHAPGAIP